MITLYVSADDIKNGIASDCKRCPIANSAMRSIPGAQYVHVTRFSVEVGFTNGQTVFFRLPENGYEFIKEFDCYYQKPSPIFLNLQQVWAVVTIENKLSMNARLFNQLRKNWIEAKDKNRIAMRAVMNARKKDDTENTPQTKDDLETARNTHEWMLRFHSQNLFKTFFKNPIDKNSQSVSVLT